MNSWAWITRRGKRNRPGEGRGTRFYSRHHVLYNMVLSENTNFLCGLPYIFQIAHMRECILEIKAAREAEKVAFNRARRVVILHIV